MADESYWVERAQSAEARFKTLHDQMERIQQESRAVLETFAARKKSDGSYQIDFERFAEQIGLDGAMELRQIIDQRYQVSGSPGEKPRIKLSA